MASKDNGLGLSGIMSKLAAAADAAKDATGAPENPVLLGTRSDGPLYLTPEVTGLNCGDFFQWVGQSSRSPTTPHHPTPTRALSEEKQLDGLITEMAEILEGDKKGGTQPIAISGADCGLNYERYCSPRLDEELDASVGGEQSNGGANGASGAGDDDLFFPGAGSLMEEQIRTDVACAAERKIQATMLSRQGVFSGVLTRAQARTQTSLLGRTPRPLTGSMLGK
jgi:hypothetical protein